MGADAPTDRETDLTIVHRLFKEVNGDHPMTEADDAYAREHFTPATPEQLSEIAAGRLEERKSKCPSLKILNPLSIL